MNVNPYKGFTLILTIVEVAKVSSIKEEVGSKEVSKATPSRAEGEGCVQVEPTSPICFTTQKIT